jgi:hypothetical protein
VRRCIVLSPYPLNVTGGSRSVQQKVVSECHSIPASAAAASQKSTKKPINQIRPAITSSIFSLVVILTPFQAKANAQCVCRLRKRSQTYCCQMKSPCSGSVQPFSQQRATRACRHFVVFSQDHQLGFPRTLLHLSTAGTLVGFFLAVLVATSTRTRASSHSDNAATFRCLRFVALCHLSPQSGK